MGRTMLLRRSSCSPLEQIDLDSSKDRDFFRSRNDDYNGQERQKHPTQNHQIVNNQLYLADRGKSKYSRQQKRLKKMEDQLSLSNLDYRNINRRNSLRSRQ